MAIRGNKPHWEVGDRISASALNRVTDMAYRDFTGEDVIVGPDGVFFRTPMIPQLETFRLTSGLEPGGTATAIKITFHNSEWTDRGNTEATIYGDFFSGLGSVDDRVLAILRGSKWYVLCGLTPKTPGTPGGSSTPNPTDCMGQDPHPSRMDISAECDHCTCGADPYVLQLPDIFCGVCNVGGDRALFIVDRTDEGDCQWSTAEFTPAEDGCVTSFKWSVRVINNGLGQLVATLTLYEIADPDPIALGEWTGVFCCECRTCLTMNCPYLPRPCEGLPGTICLTLPQYSGANLAEGTGGTINCAQNNDNPCIADDGVFRRYWILSVGDMGPVNSDLIPDPDACDEKVCDAETVLLESSCTNMSTRGNLDPTSSPFVLCRKAIGVDLNPKIDAQVYWPGGHPNLASDLYAPFGLTPDFFDGKFTLIIQRYEGDSSGFDGIHTDVAIYQCDVGDFDCDTGGTFNFAVAHNYLGWCDGDWPATADIGPGSVLVDDFGNPVLDENGQTIYENDSLHPDCSPPCSIQNCVGFCSYLGHYISGDVDDPANYHWFFGITGPGNPEIITCSPITGCSCPLCAEDGGSTGDLGISTFNWNGTDYNAIDFTGFSVSLPCGCTEGPCTG